MSLLSWDTDTSYWSTHVWCWPLCVCTIVVPFLYFCCCTYPSEASIFSLYEVGRIWTCTNDYTGVTNEENDAYFSTVKVKMELIIVHSTLSSPLLLKSSNLSCLTAIETICFLNVWLQENRMYTNYHMQYV